MDQFSSKDVKVLQTRTLYDGFFKMVQYRLQHKLFAGGWSHELTRELFERGHAAVLLPYDPRRDEVVLVEQFRVGALATSDTPWLLELVAGMIEDGESAEEVVGREAHEEAGLEVGRMQHIISYLASPGGTSERLEVYAGEVNAANAGGLHGLADEGEDIRVLVVSREQAYHWVCEGKIENAASIIALQWLQLNYVQLQEKWSG